MSDEHHFFWNGPLSQWQASSLTLDGVEFQTAEQAMMHAKALLFGDHATANRILGATDPGKQKALGREVSGFDDAIWDAAKEEIVYRINFAKFDQNKGLRRKLFQTGFAALVEASPVDTIWGIGLDASAAQETDPELWPGQNLLGNILTRVREDLKQRYPNEAVQN